MGTQAGRTAPQRMGLWVGAALFALLLWLPPPEGFTETAWRAAALAVLMAIWWATEALPIPATSMLPLAAGPLLGIADVETAGHGYGSSTIFLILGGCFSLPARALESSPDRLPDHEPGGLERPRAGAGRDGGNGLCQHGCSNTSTTLMMLPSRHRLPRCCAGSRPQRRSTSLLTAVVRASPTPTMGGLGTLIGTRPMRWRLPSCSRPRSRIGFADGCCSACPVS
jgi:sodium-dependent dicarboxylate transporter 2/3/5